MKIHEAHVVAMDTVWPHPLRMREAQAKGMSIYRSNNYDDSARIHYAFKNSTSNGKMLILL
jgi:hypothetical protein